MTDELRRRYGVSDKMEHKIGKIIRRDQSDRSNDY